MKRGRHSSRRPLPPADRCGRGAVPKFSRGSGGCRRRPELPGKRRKDLRRRSFGGQWRRADRRRAGNGLRGVQFCRPGGISDPCMCSDRHLPCLLKNISIACISMEIISSVKSICDHIRTNCPEYQQTFQASDLPYHLSCI